jgi:hypothetical protein
MRRHVVVLVPGFMGFGRFASLYYFADRVTAALRGALETRLPNPVPVVGVPTDPIGSLWSEIDARVRCIVTVAPPRAVAGATRACDGFFARLHGLTAEYAAKRPAAETERFVAALKAHAGEQIGNPSANLAEFGPETSDGIVNSARQILETHAGGDVATALGGIVVGDHGDVLGHYDREDELFDGPVLNHGFFRSGAGFGDDVFFALWQRVADQIAAAVRESASALSRTGS